MKILLTCTSIDERERNETDHDSHYPLGLAYLQSCVEKYKSFQEVETHFLNNVCWDECFNKLKNEMKNFNPDVVGISIMTHSRVSSFRFIDYIIKEYPEVKIVLGGIHPTIMWEQIVNKYKNAVVVIGEGEITFGELLECYEKNSPIGEVAGIAYHDGQKIVSTPERDLIDNLDILPFPKHDLFLFEGKTVANLLTSRGCPFKCNFCVLDHVSLKKVRYRSAKNVADEVEEILKMCPSVRNIWLHDDAFMINKKLTMEICDEIIKRDIKTTFTCSARFRPVSEELVKKMEQAGFNHVLFGLESGADNVMRGMRKGITKNHIRYAVSLFAKSNIKTTVFLIAGLPGETKETVKETINFVQELQNINYLFYDDIGVCAIYPGAEIYDISKESKMVVPGYGVINDDYWLTDGDVPVYELENTHKQLLEWKEEIRDGVSFFRMMISPKNFLQQRKIIPSILSYSWKFNFLLKQPSINILAKYNLVDEVIYSFFTNEREKLIEKFSTIVESEMVEEILKNLTNKEKKKFINDYKQQRTIDKEVLSEWKDIISNMSENSINGKSKENDVEVALKMANVAAKTAHKKANPRLKVITR
jgi:radical SAM superfamily enzyme YgiQ (UPF0313 family)